MLKFCFHLLAIVYCVGQSKAIYRKCPPNEVYSDCGNNACQNTCENPDISLLCKAVCTPGCICRPGYLRNTKGVCVPINQCDVCKGPNEFFDCGSACDTTCDTLGKPCPIINIRCNNMCYCVPGYARNRNGVCIPINQCGKIKPPRPQCPTDPNAVVLPCGNPCPLTCDNYKNPPTFCPDVCIVNGCSCKIGYVLGPRGKCIPIEKCRCKCSEGHEDDCPKPPIIPLPPTPEKPPTPKPCHKPPTIPPPPTPEKPPTPKPCHKPPTLPPPPTPEKPPTPKPCHKPPTLPPPPTPEKPPTPKPCHSPPTLPPPPIPEKPPTPKPCCNYPINPRPPPYLPPLPTPKPCCNHYPPHDPPYNTPPPIPPPTLPPTHNPCNVSHTEYCPTDPNAIVLPCGDPCPVTCNNRNNPPTVCPKICIVNGCRCKPGYVIGPNGKCILITSCPNAPPTMPLCADPNAEYVNCPNPCPGGTCAKPFFTPCRMKCPDFGCQCKIGHVKLSDFVPICIPIKTCPPCIDDDST